MPTSTRIDPYLAGNFRVDIDGIGALSFTEVLGLEASIDVVDYRTGDQKENTDQKLPGLRKYTNITLKRGYVSDMSLWNWFNGVAAGNLVRATMTITLLDSADNPVWTWTLRNAWPCRWAGPALVANSSEVAIETVEICHEGISATAQI